MRADDMRLFKLLDFRAAEGVIAFHDRRMLLYDADAMGILRRELVETVGWKVARGLLTRLGYANGYRDAHTLKTVFQWDTPEEWYKAGPVFHALEGKAVAVQVQLQGLGDGRPLEVEIMWDNCFETEQHLRHLGPATEPVCWTLTGYASGYFSACLGEEVYFVETACCATGQGCCRAVGKSRSAWGATLDRHLEFFKAASVQDEIARLERAVRQHRQAASHHKHEAERWKTLAQRSRGPKAPIAKSGVMREVLELAERVAAVDTTVLLTGQSGTGKELLARLIHARSPRAKGPFVALNCGALPEPLLESELFGHQRGSFTGATSDKQGLFEAAGHGTLFLDEIADTPPPIQVKLLRALQEREVRRVGGTATIKVDVRVLAATNKNLEQAVARREFRRDLYYRLNVVNIDLPPLRERREDILPLARLFLERYALAQGKAIRAISAEALDLLTAYPWPGNVRELENVIERAVVLANRDRITVADLPPALRSGEVPDGWGEVGPPRSLKETEKRTILAALERQHGNRSRAAKELRISPQTLWRKLKAYGVGSERE
ncbi:MAG TPA: sigma 54-interacting transcriptional regulator [Candidatus Methylomirabilis sp.]|nr:sigma 54-interacting transcriptional regulator [Candidatus Methylomirabilis sp.]